MVSDKSTPVCKTPQVVRILSNFRRMNGLIGGGYTADVTAFDDNLSLLGAVGLFFRARRYQVILLNTDSRRLLVLSLLKRIFLSRAPRLVSVDIHLAEPSSRVDKLVAWGKKHLLKRVDKFILYFRDTSGYRELYGIDPDRAVYVPFKVNQWEVITDDYKKREGEYVLTAGRGLRDLPTFIRAMRQLPYPAVLLYQKAELMKSYGTDLNLDDLPSNVRAVCHDGAQDTWMEIIANAKVVAIPALDSIRPVGISLYLLAMALGKPVVITEGVSTRGILNDEAAIVPLGDSEAFAAAIARIWEDAEYRAQLGRAALKYAQAVQGEERLLRDILAVCGDLTYGEAHGSTLGVPE